MAAAELRVWVRVRPEIALFVGASVVCRAILRTPARHRAQRNTIMKLDTDRIDDAVLALLHLGLHDGARTWKSFDWDAMARLHEKGYISAPEGKAHSVAFTEAGLRASERLCQALFGAREG